MPLNKALSITVLEDKLARGRAELSMPYKEILESNKFVHGGAIACLADAAIASSESQVRNLRTVELTVHYLDEVSRDKMHAQNYSQG